MPRICADTAGSARQQIGDAQISDMSLQDFAPRFRVSRCSPGMAPLRSLQQIHLTDYSPSLPDNESYLAFVLLFFSVSPTTDWDRAVVRLRMIATNAGKTLRD
jgi:hypothetical protein